MITCLEVSSNHCALRRLLQRRVFSRERLKGIQVLLNGLLSITNKFYASGT